MKSTRHIEFINDIIEVCEKHNLSISHEDIGGGFIVEQYKKDNIEWFKDSYFRG